MLLQAPLHLRACALAAALLCASPLHATTFTVASGTTNTSAQSLARNQTGTVEAGGTLSVAGGSVAVTLTGDNASFTNLGSALQTGTGRLVRDNTGVSGFTLTNGSNTNSSALMRTADGDVVQMNKGVSGISVVNWGQMVSLNASGGGNQVLDFNAVTDAPNSVLNNAGALIEAREADAVRTGRNGSVVNFGTIRATTTTGSSSDAIDAQNNTGLDLWNRGSGQIIGGRHGITGGAATATDSFTALVRNEAGASIMGMNGAGLNFDGFNALQVVTVVNAGTITGHGVTGDGDGIDIDGVLMLTNTGVIRSTNAVSAPAAGLAYSEGLSVGGGTITNSGRIEGLVAAGNTNAVGRGISLVGNDITAGINAGKREAIYADAVVVNLSGGVIRGDSDAAIHASGLGGSGRSVSITNQAGALLQGGGQVAVVTVASDYATTLVNAGTIDGSASGKAIELGSGANTVRIEGGNASVSGSIHGGSGAANTLTFAIGTGNSFSYDNTLSGFHRVVVDSGTVTLSGASTYTGTTVLQSGAVLQLDGADRLSAASRLELAGGTLVLLNAGGQDAQGFAALSVMASSFIALSDARLSFAALGDVASGATLTLTGASAGSPYALRVAGNWLGDTHFQSLLAGTTVNGLAATAVFDGSYTNISAVPEPATWALWLLGLGVAGGIARRRRAA